MLRVGLTGGIASGKSTVSGRLAELGAVIIDADRVAREVVEPGMPALADIAERFGPQVVDDDGALDRPALGSIVFGDERARSDLEAITHPRIVARSVELMASAPTDSIVVHDIPLLVELGREADYALTVITSVREPERLRRLVELRGMAAEQARARIAAQVTDEQREAAADVLLLNEGSVEELHSAVDQLWTERLVPFEENLRLGRPARRPERLTLVPSDPAWPGQAARLLARVRVALGDRVIRTDHVGSTSVPGLPAKDVVDLQVVVRDLEVVDSPTIRQALRDRGFLALDEGRADHAHDDAWDRTHGATWERTHGATWDRTHGATRDRTHDDAPGSGAWPKRMLGTGDPARVVHCHVRPESSPAWRLALLMRDWWRAEPDARADYLLLKERLAADGRATSEYAAAKEPWFVTAIERAEQWARESGWQIR